MDGVRVIVNRFIDLTDRVESVHLRQLPPFTTLLVWTRYSLYRIIVTDGINVHVQGGAFFPDFTPALVEGARMSSTFLKSEWIGVGFLMEIWAEGRCIVTSPVRAITTEPAGNPVVH